MIINENVGQIYGFAFFVRLIILLNQFFPAAAAAVAAFFVRTVYLPFFYRNFRMFVGCIYLCLSLDATFVGCLKRQNINALCFTLQSGSIISKTTAAAAQKKKATKTAKKRQSRFWNTEKTALNCTLEMCFKHIMLWCCSLLLHIGKRF